MSTGAGSAVVDAHAYLGKSLFGGDLGAEQLIERMDARGVDHAVVVAARPPTYELGPANEQVLRLASLSGGRLIPLARIDPWQREAAVAEARNRLAQGCRGLYLNPWEETFQIDDDVVVPVVAAAESAGKPVFVRAGHPWVSHPTQLAELARRFPSVQFVASHGAALNISGRGLHDARRLLEACPNVSVDSSGVYRQDFLEGVVRDLGAARLLFGSCTPEFDLDFELERVRTAHWDEATRSAVMGGNAAALVGLG